MTIKITALQGITDKGRLNTEWMTIANEGDQPFNADGCSIAVARGGGRPRVVTTLKAGLILQPGETCRLVTGSSGKKSHGEPPEQEGVRNFHLFLKAPYLDKPGLSVRIAARQREVARASYDPAQEGGIKAG